MLLKSYFAGTVESALCLARQEMGEDAMLVNSRKAAPEARHLGAYEVVFAVAQDSAFAATEAARARIARQPKPEAPSAPPSESLSQEVAEMRRQLARVAVQVSRSTLHGRRSQ